MLSLRPFCQWLKKGLAVAQRLIDRHQFALTAMVVVVPIILYVPQLASMWRKLPRVQDQGNQLVSALGFTLFVPLLVMFYLTSWLSILRVHERGAGRCKRGVERPRPGWERSSRRCRR